jgi:hypothetical protein
LTPGAKRRIKGGAVAADAGDVEIKRRRPGTLSSSYTSAVLGIRIQSDPKLLALSGLGSGKKLLSDLDQGSTGSEMNLK